MIKSFRFTILLGMTLAALFWGQKWFKDRSPFLSPASEFSKESALFSENAFYYYFFKKSVSGDLDVWNNNVFTFPDSVKAPFEFNIWQELMAAQVYKLLGNSTGLDFYLSIIFVTVLLILLIPGWLQSLLPRSPSVHAFILFILLTQFEWISRAQHFPLLRENFGLPFFFLVVATTLINLISPSRQALWTLGIATFFHGIFWQFSMISHAALNACLLLIFIWDRKYLDNITAIFKAQLIALAAATLLMGLNSFYLFSWSLSLLFFGWLAFRFKRWWILPFFLLPPLLLGDASDHVVQLLQSVLFGKENFHTLLYKATPAFLPLNSQMYEIFFHNGLLILIGLSVVSLPWVKKELRPLILIPVCFSLQAAMMMRLMPLAILSWCSFWWIILGSVNFRWSHALAALAGLMFLYQSSTQNPFNPGLQDNSIYQSLLQDLKSKLPNNAVIATDFTLSSALALHTPYRFILHPQYESMESRRRNVLYHRVYAQYAPETIAKMFDEYRVTHIIFQAAKCYGQDDLAKKFIEALHVDHRKEIPVRFCQIYQTDVKNTYQRVGVVGPFTILERRAE